MRKNVLFVAITIIAFAMSSCVIVEHNHKKPRHDNGKHKGWYKHKGHPKKGTTVIIVPDNNGKSNGKGNGKGKGKKK